MWCALSYPSKPPAAIILGCQGLVLSADERAFFRDLDPLGFILFARNCETPAQIAALTASLRECVGRRDAPILIDQEGGRVVRLKPPHFPEFPAMGLFGELAKGDVAAAAEACRLNGQLLGIELAALGIDVNCAPVLDLRISGASPVIGDRAFSSQPLLVASLGEALCIGLQEAGVTPVIKHMPGHGRALDDSHETLPKVDAPRFVLNGSDFRPFQLLNNQPWGMVAHVVYTDLDPTAPASTSPLIVEEILRGALEFDGVLIADDIGMQALQGSMRERVEATLRVLDLTEFCNGSLADMVEIAPTARPVTEKNLGAVAARLFPANSDHGRPQRHTGALRRCPIPVRGGMSIAFAEDIVMPQETPDGQFLLDLDGYDGPIDLLLQLARDKKIDLTCLSISHLADQYVTYIERVRHVHLEIAADYLVMAAWLTYLKSRLLLPVPIEDELSAEEQAEALAFQLRRLDSMRLAGVALLERPQKDSHFLSRAGGETYAVSEKIHYQANLAGMLRAYGAICRRTQPVLAYDIPELPLHSVDMALERLSLVLGKLPQWSELAQFLPAGLSKPLLTRSAIAATFGASLELVKRGAIQLRQEKPFAALYVRGVA